MAVKEIDYGVSPGRPKKLRGTNAERLAYDTTNLADGSTFVEYDDTTKTYGDAFEWIGEWITC